MRFDDPQSFAYRTVTGRVIIVIVMMRAVRMYRELTGVIIVIVIDTMRTALFEVDLAGTEDREGMKVDNKTSLKDCFVFHVGRSCSLTKQVLAQLDLLKYEHEIGVRLHTGWLFSDLQHRCLFHAVFTA